MKNLLVMIAAVLLLSTIMLGQNGTPSSKATAAINTAVGCTYAAANTLGDTLTPVNCHDIFTGVATSVTPDNFATIMTSTIKVSNSQSLFVSPSLVTGLYTNTRVKSSPGSGLSTAVASGGVYLRAVIKNQVTNEQQVAFPVAVCTSDILGCYADVNGSKGVALDTRVQTLTQEISNCMVTFPGIVGTGSCTFDLTTNLILQTTSAHTFNFIFPKVGQGVYTIEIQAAVNAAATATSGSAIGAAAYGLGSVTVESVRLVHDFAF